MDPAAQHNALLLLVQIGIIIGLVGLLLPVFPGLLVAWGAILVYGLLNGFSAGSGLLFAVITLVAIAASLADNVLMAGGAAAGGASASSVTAAMLAGVAGTLLLPPLGGLLGAPLAVLLLEYKRQRDWQRAKSATIGMMKGYGVAFVIRFLGGVLMMVLWWIWVAAF